MHPHTLRRTRLAWLVSLVAVGLLSACATAEESSRLKAGWASGYVQTIGTAAEIGPQNTRLDCRPMAEAGDQSNRFVLVRYANGRLRHSVIAPLPPGQDVGIHQQVWVDVHECRPVEPRTDRS